MRRKECAVSYMRELLSIDPTSIPGMANISEDACRNCLHVSEKSLHAPIGNSESKIVLGVFQNYY
jgi:hypothetical protein